MSTVSDLTIFAGMLSFIAYFALDEKQPKLLIYGSILQLTAIIMVLL